MICKRPAKRYIFQLPRYLPRLPAQAAAQRYGSIHQDRVRSRYRGRNGQGPGYQNPWRDNGSAPDRLFQHLSRQ